jgi:V/A-type H+-transporting ATPase subunit E
MAGVDGLKDRILREAEETAAETLLKAEKESAEILEKTKARAELKKRAMLESAEKTGLENAGRIISTARMQVRNQKLEAMQELISMVFDRAVEAIRSMDDKRYGEILLNMILHSALTGDEEIVMSPKDRLSINSEFMIRLNSALKASGLKGQMKLSDETREIQGGFILKSKGVEINGTVEAIVRSLRDSIEKDIVSILFA